MSAYRDDDEGAIRVQRLLKDWMQSGLIQPEQREQMLTGIQVDLRRTNLFLRITLFIFSMMIMQSAAGLLALVVGVNDDTAAVVALIAAAAFYGTAHLLVTRSQLYHFGVEEAAAVASIAGCAIGMALLVGSDVDANGNLPIITGFVAGAVASSVIFWRYGYVYAAIAAMGLSAAVPFLVGEDDATHRVAAALVLAAVCVFARLRRASSGHDYPADTYAVVEAAAWAGIYLLTNLRLTQWLSLPALEGGFYWATYVAIWIIPVIGLWLAIRDRLRWLLDVNIALAIVTLMSNKPYLGAMQNTWDPIVFGVVLMVVAVGLKRWLSTGAGGSRNGWIAERLLASEKERLALAGAASVLAPGAPAPHSDSSPGIGAGGESGGAGASGKF